jgi:RNA polymerase primary sigma factor
MVQRMRELKIGAKNGAEMVITRRDSKSIICYLQEISKLATITPEEEQLLCEHIAANPNDCKEAVDKLVKANLRFVVSVAKQYARDDMPLPDLINEGNLAMAKCARKFDPTRGFKFITYAVWWIRQAMLSYVYENKTTIRLPLNKINLINKLNTVLNDMDQDMEGYHDISEIASRMDLTVDKVYDLFSIRQLAISLDSPIAEGANGSMVDLMASEEVEENNNVAVELVLAYLKDNIKEKDYEIFKDYIYSEHSKTLITNYLAEKHGMTNEGIKQSIRRTSKKLKNEKYRNKLTLLFG